MPRIVAVETAVPVHEVRQEEIQELACELFATMPHLDRLLSIFKNTGIDRRYLCKPLEWFRQRFDFGERNRLYIQQAVELGTRVSRNCFEAAGVRPQEVDAFFLVSSTGLATPSLDAHIMGRLGMNPHTQRTPIWGLGCAGGAAGLARSYHYALAHPRSKVMLLAVELCGLAFQHQDQSKSNLVATSLFADGAAAAVITGDEATERGVDIVGVRSTLWPDSLSVMGWDVSGDGLGVIFSRDIPMIVRRWFHGAVTEFLEGLDLELTDIGRFILHPGGARVLDAYAAALGLSQDDLSLSRRILSEYGNMSSPTVLFALSEWMRSEVSPDGELGLLAALGPGFSCEQVLLRSGSEE